MAARGEPQDGIFRKQPLGGLEAAESESFVRMIEPQLELPASARVHPVLRFRREPQPHLPEELAPGESEAVASPHPYEMLDRGALELGWCPAHEVADAHVPAPLLALDHHSRRRLLAPVPDEPEPHSHCVGMNRSLLPAPCSFFYRAPHVTQIHVRQPNLDAVSVRVSSQHVERVE